MDLGALLDLVRKEGGAIKRAPLSFVSIAIAAAAAGWLANGAILAERIAVAEQRVELHRDRAGFSQEQLNLLRNSLSNSAPGEVEILSPNPEALSDLSGAISDAGWQFDVRPVEDWLANSGEVLLEAPSGLEADALQAALEASGIDFGFRMLEPGETPRLWIDHQQMNQE